MLVLSNQEIDDLITMKQAIDAIEDAYLENSKGYAIDLPRSDCYSPIEAEETRFHLFLKTMGGTLVNRKYSILRVTSDILAWSGMRRVKIPSAEGKWVGLLLLFSSVTGKLLAMMPDGVIQATRVGATSGLGVKYLSRHDAKIAAIIGSGWQAGKQLLALASVRDIEEVRVYSPTKDNRENFVARMSGDVECRLVSSSSAEEAVRDAHIVMCATNSTREVVEKEWLRQGTHISTLRRTEVGIDTIRYFDKVFINSSHGKPISYKPLNINEDDIPDLASERMGARIWPNYSTLIDVVGGKVEGRNKPSEVTLFMNNMGIGTQFAAVVELVYQKALEKGLGRELSDEWFMQDVHS